MLTLPFANPIGPASGPAGDGVLYGVLPQVAPVTVLNLSHLGSLTRVLRGNADAAGAVTWTDVTTAVNNDTPDDVTIFDSANPTADRLCLVLDPNDKIDAINLLVSTAGVLTGTPSAQVHYKTSAGWQTASGVVTPSLSSVGVKTISFPAIDATDLVLVDDPINAMANPQLRCIFVQFAGTGSVTTAPSCTRVWKRIAQAAVVQGDNLTALMSQGANPDFSAAQAQVTPVTNDLLLFGFDEKPIRLLPTLYRGASSSEVREWVYSRGSGSFSAIGSNINDASSLLAAGPGGHVGNALVDTSSVPGQTILIYQTPGNSSFTPPAGVTSVRALLVGGGGGGGGSHAGGGGGAGGFRDIAAVAVTPGTSLPITVGGGGAGGVGVRGTSGLASVIDVLSASGGGGGGSEAAGIHAGLAGGSGGGGSGTAGTDAVGGAGNTPSTTPAQGTNGAAGTNNGSYGAGGGGGGASATGAAGTGNGSGVSIGGNGGSGQSSNITGTATTYAGGGGGGGWSAASGSGGAGGGGAGGAGGSGSGSAGANNLGGGGGGSGASGTVRNGGSGGSGVVIISFPRPTTTPIVSIMPPADWTKDILTDTLGVAHSRYWIGLKTTADTPLPVLPANFTVRGQPIKGPGIVGIPALATETLTKLIVAARTSSPAETQLVLVNSATGTCKGITLPANDLIASTVMSMPVTKDDPLLLVQPKGHSSTNIGDGFVLASS